MAGPHALLAPQCQPVNGLTGTGSDMKDTTMEMTMEQDTLTLEASFDEHVEVIGTGVADAGAGAAGEQASNEMECFSTDDPELILKARQLMAQVYLKRDFITAEEITDEGVLSAESDPHGSHSTYYVVVPKNQRTVLATVRIIHYDAAKGEDSFPVMKYKQMLDPAALEVLASVGAQNLVEVSALARDKHLAASNTATLMLYKRIFMDACYDDANGKKSLIMATNPMLFTYFGLLFGDAFMRLGPDLPYPGQPASPAILQVQDGTIHIAKASRDKKNPYRKVQEGVVNYFGAGANANLLSEVIPSALVTYGYGDLLAKMKANDWTDVPAREARAFNMIKRGAVLGKLKELFLRYRPEILAAIVLMVYTVARTGLVAESISPVATGVDWRVFLGIEIATTAPYVWGIGDLARNVNNHDYSTSRKVSAYALAGSALVAPYAYLAAQGTLHTEQGTVIAGALLALSIGPTLAKQINKKLNKHGIRLPRLRNRTTN
jgi:hypothetical protein